MFKSQHADIAGPHQETVRRGAEHALGAEGAAVLHEIDYEDVSITPEGARMVMSAARSLVGEYMPAKDPASLTVRECIALFLDHIFWDENSGGLVMCSDVDTHSVCLPLPSRCWRVRTRSRLLH